MVLEKGTHTDCFISAPANPVKALALSEAATNLAFPR